MIAAKALNGYMTNLKPCPSSAFKIVSEGNNMLYLKVIIRKYVKIANIKSK